MEWVMLKQEHRLLPDVAYGPYSAYLSAVGRRRMLPAARSGARDQDVHDGARLWDG